MTRRIDAHQHFWRPARGDYGWLTPALAPLCRDFLPADLVPLLRANGVEGTVLVQAAPTDAETDFMLSLADENDFILGVVGWTDFAAPDAPEKIAALARHAKLKGLRPMIQDIPDDDWMLRPELGPAFEALIRHDLVFDALVLPRHLGRLATLLARWPELRVLVDHGAKPEIEKHRFDAWARDMKSIAEHESVVCKLSGLVTEAGPGWSVESLAPYVDHLLACFGAGRLVWGSDWPVVTLAATYGAWVEATDRLLSGCSLEEKRAILGGNARIVYRLREGFGA